jgi:hypothetical protein
MAQEGSLADMVRTAYVRRVVDGLGSSGRNGSDRGGHMRLARIPSIAALVGLSLAVSAPAMADPPPTNPNANVLTFDCARGPESQTFLAVGILQNAAIAGQRLDGHGVIVFTHVEVDGQVVFDKPGQAGRPDLWSCTIAELPGAVVDAVLTPRAGQGSRPGS